MRCQDVRLELPAYLGGELTAAAARTVKEHLLVCPACSREFVAVQAVERDLKAGLETPSLDSGNWGPWVSIRAAELSQEEMNRRREWVAGLSADQASAPQSLKRGTRKTMFTRTGFKAVALTAVLAVLLFAFFPQVVRASAQVPFLGDWVRQLIFKDAGLAWAYEHGYISKHQDTVSKDGFKLTILGTVADPIQTTVIFLVEGTDEIPPIGLWSATSEIFTLYSWTNQQANTPLGFLGMVHTDPLPPGEQQLKMEVKELGLTIDIPVTRELVSRASQEYTLDFEETVGEATLKVHRLIYTPTQIKVEYNVFSSDYVAHSNQFPAPDMFLVDGKGKRMQETRSTVISGNNNWKGYYIFNRPRNMHNLSLFISGWAITQPVDLSFTPGDVGKELSVAGSTLTLVSWERNGPVWGSEDILELQIKSDGWIQDLAEWEVDALARPTMQRKVNGNLAVGFTVPDDFTPKKITARLAHVVVPDNWEIPLPAAE